MVAYISGHCGITVTGDPPRRVTYGKEAHVRCTGLYADTKCACTCHSGGSPWDTIGTLIRKPVGLPEAQNLQEPKKKQERRSNNNKVDLREEIQKMVDLVEDDENKEEN